MMILFSDGSSKKTVAPDPGNGFFTLFMVIQFGAEFCNKVKNGFGCGLKHIEIAFYVFEWHCCTLPFLFVWRTVHDRPQSAADGKRGFPQHAFMWAAPSSSVSQRGARVPPEREGLSVIVIGLLCSRGSLSRSQMDCIARLVGGLRYGKPLEIKGLPSTARPEPRNRKALSGFWTWCAPYPPVR